MSEMNNYRVATPEERAWKKAVQENEAARARFTLIETTRRLKRAEKDLAAYIAVDNEPIEETAKAFGWDADGFGFSRTLDCHICKAKTTASLPSWNYEASKEVEGRWARSRGYNDGCDHAKYGFLVWNTSEGARAA